MPVHPGLKFENLFSVGFAQGRMVGGNLVHNPFHLLEAFGIGPPVMDGDGVLFTLQQHPFDNREGSGKGLFRLVEFG